MVGDRADCPDTRTPFAGLPNSETTTKGVYAIKKGEKNYLPIPTNSTSKMRVELGGMGPMPREPYPSSGGITN